MVGWGHASAGTGILNREEGAERRGKFPLSPLTEPPGCAEFETNGAAEILGHCRGIIWTAPLRAAHRYLRFEPRRGATMVPCRSCGASISERATKCPKCGTTTRSEPVLMQPCKTCRTPLEATVHRYRESQSVIIDGNSSLRWFTHHRPCTNCGEPEPLKQLGDSTGNQLAIGCGLLMLILTPLVLYIAFALS